MQARNAFPLRRYFSYASATVLTVALIMLAFIYRQNAVSDLVKTLEFQNVALTQMLANSIWPHISSHVMSASEFSPSELKNHSRTKEIFESLKILMSKTPIIKIKIYDLNGLTVFSTNKNQIGEDKSKNLGFLTAVNGEMPPSKLAYKNELSAFSGAIFNRDVVESYLPIFNKSRKVEGVFELYTDVTLLVTQINRTVYMLMLVLLLIFGALYLTLSLIVRHGALVIDNQQKEIFLREQRQEEFVANVAHELRTPLSLLRLGIENLGSAKNIKPLCKDIDAMARLVSQLLVKSRLSSLTIEPDDQADLLEISHNVATKLAPIAINAGKEIELCGVTEPVIINGKADVVEQAVRNIVENAIKYSDSHSLVTIKVTKTPSIIVVNKGPGINVEEREVIFDRFYQTAQKAGGGIGLGLSIVRDTMELHGGTINVENAEGGGVVFSICFPAISGVANS